MAYENGETNGPPPPPPSSSVPRIRHSVGSSASSSTMATTPSKKTTKSSPSPSSSSQGSGGGGGYGGLIRTCFCIVVLVHLLRSFDSWDSFAIKPLSTGEKAPMQQQGWKQGQGILQQEQEELINFGLEDHHSDDNVERMEGKEGGNGKYGQPIQELQELQEQEQDKQGHRQQKIKKEAIIWLTDVVSECQVHRIRHLTQSAKTIPSEIYADSFAKRKQQATMMNNNNNDNNENENAIERDVWVIHGDQYLSSELSGHRRLAFLSRRRVASIANVRIHATIVNQFSHSKIVGDIIAATMRSTPSYKYMVKKYNMTSHPKKEEEMGDTEISMEDIPPEASMRRLESSLLSAFRIIKDLDYDAGWIIGHDTIYTGDWKHLFDSMSLPSSSSSSSSSSPSFDDADLLFPLPMSPTTGSVATPSMNNNNNNNNNDDDNMNLSKQPWHLTRISNRLASSIWDLEYQLMLENDRHDNKNYDLIKQKRVTMDEFLMDKGFSSKVISSNQVNINDKPIYSFNTEQQEQQQHKQEPSSSSSPPQQHQPPPPPLRGGTWPGSEQSMMNNKNNITISTTTTTMTPQEHSYERRLDETEPSLGRTIFQQKEKYQKHDITLQPNKIYHPVSCFPYYYYNDNEMEELIDYFFPVQKPPNSKHVRHDSPEYEIIQPPTPPFTPNGKEGIFFTTMALNDCEAVRLRQLVETATSPTSKTKRDVWILHSHYKLHPDSEQVRRSNELIASIPGLKVASQFSIPVDPFDDSRTSGSSKSSVLRMMVEHQYSYGWQVENDIFFTGNWSTFFDVMSGNSDEYREDYNVTNINPMTGKELIFYGTPKFWEADVISGAVSYRKRWSDNWWQDNNGHTCYIDESTICPDVATDNYNWPFIRVSYKFAYGILTEMEHGQVRGMHEAIVASYLAKRNLTVGIMPQHFNGGIGLGSWGKFREPKYQRLERDDRTVSSNELYHPVKCSAYGNNAHEIMKELIHQWT